MKKNTSQISIQFNKFISKLFYALFIFYLLQVSVDGFSYEKLSKITTSDVIKKEGYPSEEHEIVTDDGYILTVYRIPGGSNSTPVFVQHGFLSSSFDWVLSGKNKALAFILADNGYDVWLGNARGNTYSKRHKSLKTSDSRFWNFSLHEMGVYDLPAVITYITDLRNTSLIYVGHSLGSTVSYIMATERPDMVNKVRVIFSFSPIAYMRKFKSPAHLLAIYPPLVEIFIKALGIHDFLPQNLLLNVLRTILCPTFANSIPCPELIFLLAGYNPSQFNYVSIPKTLMPLITSHIPAGTSVKTGFHFLQMSKTGRFQKYDYGYFRNKNIYHSAKPPEYNLSKIQIPIGIFWAENDILSDPSDAQAFYKAIPKKVLNYRVPSPSFSHLDFIWAIDAKSLVYSKLLSAMEEYL